ncbi:hypothetical protein Clacol_003756 [Clathrus columnatus]|uniref:Spc7 kinetochore protein domain-containing protein n=1 Tax=Clathrus columnatus TaxID=1419009 RepID=A0AAV5A8L4_9AGAM|nr:hypothetical protein Clacol_003756 [Clathrus columnatus]
MPRENNLLKRSPRSRKSLALGKNSNTLSPKQKRAHSIAPGEKISLNAPRRSILRPPRGILKPSNQSDLHQDTVQSVTQILSPWSNPNFRDSIDVSASLSTGEFYANVNDNNTTRKSLGGRRTSEQQGNENSSPSQLNEAKNALDLKHQSPSNSKATDPESWQSRRTDNYSRSHFDSTGVQDEEESMELSDDIILPQISTEGGNFSESMSEASDSSMEDENMSMTGHLGGGSPPRRQSLTVASEPRRGSRMRSSISIPVSTNGSTDFTVSVDRPPPPESDAFKALKAMANGNRPDTNENDEETGELDMDVTTAVSRLMAARDSVGMFYEGDSFSTDDSMDAANDHTMNMTSVMGNLRSLEMNSRATQEDEEMEETMSVASLVEGNILDPVSSLSNRPQSFQTPRVDRNLRSRIPVSLSVPKFTRSVESELTVPSLSEKTPLRLGESSVAPAFVPKVNPAKRLASPRKSISSKKIILPTDQAPLQIADPSEYNQTLPPHDGTLKSTRRPSGHYRKSLTSIPATEVHTQITLPKDTCDDQPNRNEPSSLGEQRFETDLPESLQSENSTMTEESMITSGKLFQNRSSISGDSVIKDNMDPISIDQFLTMTSIHFMDDLTCPRRSTIHPSQMKRQTSIEGSGESSPLSSYVIGMAIHVAQLETMIWISNDIKTAIDKYKAQYQQTEDDIAKDIPLLFCEYFAASEEDREPILYVLKLIKTHTISSAKANWYEWKRGWIQGLQTNALRTLENLDADKDQLVDISTRASETIPFLRAEYEAISQGLEVEQAAIAEIQQCDQQFLSELKATIAEQSHELDLLRTEIKEGENKLEQLEETAETLREQMDSTEKAIKITQRQLEMQKTSTRAEVFCLRDELQCLQDLHLWRIINMNPSTLELVYDSKYKVTIPCHHFIPVPDGLQISPVEGAEEDDFPLLSQFMLGLASRYAVRSETKATLRSIIQRLSDFWTSYFQLRWQLSFITIKYPLSCQLLPSGSTVNEARGFQATVTVLLLNKTAKAKISFSFNEDLLSQWPNTLSALQYTVGVIYGQVSAYDIEEAIGNRLREAKPEENHACLVDACMEVTSSLINVQMAVSSNMKSW